MEVRTAAFATVLAAQLLDAAAPRVACSQPFQVNQHTPASQFSPALTTDAAGNFVVVWSSLGVPGAIDLDRHVEGRRYDPSGAPLGSEFRLSESGTCVRPNTICPHIDPAIGADASGGLVVAWGGFTDQWFDGRQVKARRFAADGTPLGPPFVVAPDPGGFVPSPSAPALTVDSAGGFVVAWSRQPAFGFPPNPEVFARRYDEQGLPLGPEFQVNTYTTDLQVWPALASGPGGSFVAVWQSRGSAGGDDSGTSIQARVYDGAGAPLGGELQVNTYTTGMQLRPAVAADAAGNFVVAWESWGSNGGDTSEGSVQARLFSPAGAPLGGAFQVNVHTTGEQGFPAVAMEPGGAFVLAWQDGSSVVARRFDAGGAPAGGEVWIPVGGPDAQRRGPAVAALPAGDFVVAWGSDEGSDGDYLDAIQAVVVTGAWIFLDGFETGDPSRWSATTP